MSPAKKSLMQHSFCANPAGLRNQVSAATSEKEDSDRSGPITGSSKALTCHISITIKPDFNSDFCLGCVNTRRLPPPHACIAFGWRPLSSLFTPYKWNLWKVCQCLPPSPPHKNLARPRIKGFSLAMNPVSPACNETVTDSIARV